MANIQIPESLFYDIIRYYLIASKGEAIPEELDKRVFNGLSDKVQKIADREIYTIYKTAPTEEEREKARKSTSTAKAFPKVFDGKRINRSVSRSCYFLLGRMSYFGLDEVVELDC